MLRIAVVDDSEAWCFVVAQFLSQHGYSVSTFTDANLFLQQAGRFDLALVDFSIPPRRYQREINGPEIISILKQQLAKPPVLVLISAYFTEDFLPQARTISPQADAYFSKSIELAELLHHIEHLLANRSLS